MRIVLLALLLAGCTTAKTMMLDDRTALISGRDSGWGDASDVKRKVLVTAAEMARARGYEYFEIVGSADTTKRGYVMIPGQSTATTQGSAYCTGRFCSGQATTNTYGNPGYLAPVTKAGADVTVRFYHAGEAPAGAISAAAVLASK